MAGRDALAVLEDDEPSREPSNSQPRADHRAPPGDGGSLDVRLAGASFGELPEALRRQGASGVLVSAVAPGSRAYANGLRSGDVILSANSGGFDDLDSFRASFARSPRQLVLTVWRGGQRGQLLMQ